MASPNQFGFIHITNHGLMSADSLCSWVIIKAGNLIVQGQGNLREAAVACAKVPTALALSVHDLILTKVTLPTKVQSQRRTAIPYAIQNQLATPAADMHWSWRAKGQQLQLVGIANPHIMSINTTMQVLHFSPKWLVADGLQLGGYESQWQLMALPNSLLLQQGHHSACCIASETPSDWLQKAYDEAHNSAVGEPLGMSITGPVSEALNQWFTSTGIDIKTHETYQDFNSASILAQGFDAKSCINLWPQSPQNMWAPNVNWQLWRLPFTLTVLLALLGLSHLWLNNITTAQQIDANYKQGVVIFQHTLPNERLVDPFSQLQSQVLAAKKPKQTVLFLPMLQAFKQLNASFKQGSEATDITAVKFLDEQLKITLTANIKALKQWLKKGGLGKDFAYEIDLVQQLENNDEAVIITISSLEAR